MKRQSHPASLFINKLILSTITAVFVFLGFALLVSGFAIVIGTAFSIQDPLFIGAVVVLSFLLINPLRNSLQQKVDSLFSRGQPIQKDRLNKFRNEITNHYDLSSVTRILRETVQTGLNPAIIHIFVYDPHVDQYRAAAGADGKPTTELQFQANSQLVEELSTKLSPISLAKTGFNKAIPHSDQSRLVILEAQVIASLASSKRLSGWVVLGPKKAGESYTRAEMSYLESICKLAAAAIERAEMVASLENRVREMDVLSRVSQGVNITPAFDDILELVYAQTSQVVPCTDLQITLKNHTGDSLYHAFYLENNERINDKEKRAIPAGRGLEEVVIRSQRTLITDDYHQECRLHGATPAVQGIYSWMSVPLNAGAQTIGSLSLGSRDPIVVYTKQQCNLLQSIADLAAGAIVKTRLIEESDQRARQLTMLNEIGRSLTSTLEINSLLNLILQNATEILNSEAGSLFLIDEQTDELVFEVTAGPVAENLVGQRLFPGTGIVGQAVETGKPLIANDAQRSVSWSDQTDKQTGFVTRDLLVVPMQVKDRIIGVIEIINKKDSSPFTIDDQELLSTFASQAAIAIENVRLYTQTDKALSERVNELSVMQRIDRDLNASLELERALRITLDWATRQTGAEAGFIGLVERDETEQRWCVRISASQGYSDLLDNSQDETMFQAGNLITSLELPLLQSVIEEGQPLPNPFILQEKDGRSNIVIPIRRRGEIIGIILLTSNQLDLFTIESGSFLSRLSDHAAIAISNAQLYADLQQANIAKSEFVSLVSHELKTPMTSIKGYSDLLAKGTVGPVNEIQTNFLNTIRSNVNRMSTLVSDLADISRIEAGRMRLEFTSVSIEDVVNEVSRSAQAQIAEKEQTLEINIPGDLPQIWGDANRIIQVVTNLVSNANKYTPLQGHIAITAEKTTNEWDANGAPEVVVFRVKDSGYGIAPEDQKKIFQKFFRSEDQNIREASGTGLGLNITRHLVEMQGGKIWFESEYRKGTQFSFTVPVAAVA